MGGHSIDDSVVFGIVGFVRKERSPLTLLKPAISEGRRLLQKMIDVYLLAS